MTLKSYLMEQAPAFFQNEMKSFGVGTLVGSYMSFGIMCTGKVVRYASGIRFLCISSTFFVPIIVIFAIGFFSGLKLSGNVGYYYGFTTGFKFVATLIALDDIELMAMALGVSTLFFYLYGGLFQLIIYGWDSKK